MSGDTGNYREGDRRQGNAPGKSTDSSFKRFLRNMGFSQPPTADLQKAIRSNTNEMRTLLNSAQNDQEGTLRPTQISNFPSSAENTQASSDEIRVISENSANDGINTMKANGAKKRLDNMREEINDLYEQTRLSVEVRNTLKHVKRYSDGKYEYRKAKEDLKTILNVSNRKLEEMRVEVRVLAWERNEKADPMKRYIHNCLEKKASVEDLLRDIRGVKEGISTEDVIYAFGSVNEWYLRNFNDLWAQHSDNMRPQSIGTQLENTSNFFKALMAKALKDPDVTHIRSLADLAIMLEDQKVKIKDSVIKGAWNSVNSTRSRKALYGDKTDDSVLKLVFPTRRTRWNPKSNAYELYESGPFEDWS